ncbi:MAG: adenylyltransferase/cytidyltransferase family protein [Candidatus Altiarchaeota archaeon]
MKKVVATGVFGILHPGHLLFLREAKKLGDKLIVIVARDENVKKKKNDFLIIPEKQRLEIIKAIRYVDMAILGDEKDIFKPIERIKPDIIVLGKNQEIDEAFLEEELKKRNLKAKVIRIKKFFSGELNSTSKIIEKIREL